MESISKIVSQFIENVKSFFAFLEEINDYLKTTKGEAPVEPFLLLTAKGFIDNMSTKLGETIMTTFALRAVPHYDFIKNRDLPYFRDIASELFPEIPKNLLAPITKYLMDDKLPDSIKENIFEYVDYFLELAVSRQIVLHKEGKKTVVSQGDLLAVAKKIPLSQEYLSAVSA